MSSLRDIGNLMLLYLDEIDPGTGSHAPAFVVKATAQVLNQTSGHNTVPVIVKETARDQYEVIANSFVYAVAEAAGLDRVWCIVTDGKDDSVEVARALAQEDVPKLNLSTASRDEIASALEYLMEQPGSVLKSIRKAIAINRIHEAPRQFWKTLDPITALKCGITKGAKLNALKQVFYLTPQPMPDTLADVGVLRTLTKAELQTMAKTRGIVGFSKMNKDSLVEILNQPLQ